MQVRLQKYIADAGYCSRRHAEGLILEGKVSVNGGICITLGTKVDPETDLVSIEGNLIDESSKQKLYFIFNKPRCIMSTTSDPQGRPTVLDYFKEYTERIYPVGRLDYLSEGLLILTNDGEMAQKIMHPRFEVKKVYEVKVFGKVSIGLLKKIQSGTVIDGEHVKPLSVRVIKELEEKTWLEFTLGEGKNREIRRICESLGITVDKLRRMAIEGLSIEGIPIGKYRKVSKRDLMNLLGMGADGKRNVHAKKNFYASSKKTVKAKDKASGKSLASDRSFYKFRKEHYYDTIKDLKEKRDLKDQDKNENKVLKKDSNKSKIKRFSKTS